MHPPPTGPPTGPPIGPHTGPPTGPPAVPAAERRAPGAPFGFLLLAPAALAAVLGLLVPTGYVLLASLRSANLFGSGRFVGLDNYLAVLSSERVWYAAGRTVALVILPALMLLVLVPMLGVLLDRAGTWLRLAGRIVLSLPLAAYSPVALAAAWDVPLNELTFPAVVGASAFGMVAGLGLIVALAVLRGRGRGRSAAGAVAVIAVLALVAACLQAFTFPSALPLGGRHQTLAEVQFAATFLQLQSGRGAALATVVGLLLGALGVAAVLVMNSARLRIELLPRATRSEPSAARGGAWTAAAVVALLVMSLGIIATQLPWLIDLVGSEPRPEGPRIVYPELRIQLNTWLPPLISSIVAVGVALVAAIGIGGLRPLGRRSELLLLPFAPWLFVGLAPLSLAFFDLTRELRLYGTFVGLIPPTLLSVPALVVLTLFCRGQSQRWLARPAPSATDFLTVVVLPALPLAGLLAVASTLVGAQSLSWQLVAARPPEATTATVLAGRPSPLRGFTDVSAMPWVAVLVLLAIFVAAQIWYLDRVAVSAGDDVPAGHRPYDDRPDDRPHGAHPQGAHPHRPYDDRPGNPPPGSPPSGSPPSGSPPHQWPPGAARP